ncbi:zinc ribbon domain-containing protein [bacterium]|nr:zinc ribbon domain-containing protein [bacterium]
MPIYEYRCGRCSRVFEALIRKPSDESEEVCPHCGGHEKERLFSVFGMAGVEKAGGGSCGSCSSHNCGSCSCG